ncbi:MAG: bestrophin family ion channel [Candidatus Obscuribacterales bacterium]|nr:bestrophin family ion channel [Candidatus Obscuribacterales bacterium]
MYIRNEIKASVIWWFCWKHVVFFLLYSLAVYSSYHKLGWKFISIPFLPVGTIGTAVAFYVGFKNNASYERLWEARKIWGSIANFSRALGIMANSIPDSARGLKETLINRQIAWCKLFSLQLRERGALRNSHKIPPEVALVKKVYGENYDRASVRSFVDSEVTEADRSIILSAQNPSLRLLELQVKDAMLLSSLDLERAKVLLEQILEILVECVKEQGSAERLKDFPFPRQYAYFSGVFVWIFLLLLPFGLLDELTKVTGLDWLIVPFSTLISWMFITMEQVGDSSEDPFEMGLNDVPMSAICRNIEIELLSMIDAAQLPEPLLPIGDILL